MELAANSRLLLDLRRSREENRVPARREIDGARKYLALDALRLDNRLTVNRDVGKFPRQAIMPVFIWPPSLGNAIHHGIDELAIGGMVNVRLLEENDQMHIRAIKPIPTVRARQEKSTPARSLDDIRQRFQSHYSGQASLISVEEAGRFAVTVVLPTRGGNP